MPPVVLATVVVRRGDQCARRQGEGGTFQADECLSPASPTGSQGRGVGGALGSFCVDGEARYAATRVGAASFANQITAGARAFRAERTPLQEDVTRILRGMALLVLVAAVPVLFSLYQQYGYLPAVETARAAAVLVALIPQGLVVMVTVTYALAIVRLAGQKALIQRANAVESMSRVSVLCLDKTGTLTTPEIEVAEVHPIGDETELARWVGAFASSIGLRNRTSDAIAEHFPGHARLPVTEEVEFSSELRWSALAVEADDGPCLLVLGAPEVVRPHLATGDHGGLDDLVHAKADEGLRVVMFCRRPGEAAPPLSPDAAPGTLPTLPADLEPLGVLVLRERVRPDARPTLERFADAGVTLKLISGDNPVTVAALARQVGLSLDGTATSGLDLEHLDDAGLRDAVRQGSVFGRVPPSLKARLVAALRRDGEWVAMVGDGVNDILSLKQAQLGIAMQSGSQATRAVADIVLLDDSFSALPEAVIEGQRIVAGMTDSMALFLTRVLYMALAILVTAVAGLAMPVDPKHNTVVPVTVGIPALALAYWRDPRAPGFDAVPRIPRSWCHPRSGRGMGCRSTGGPAPRCHCRARTTFTTLRCCAAAAAAVAPPAHRRLFANAHPHERPRGDRAHGPRAAPARGLRRVLRGTAARTSSSW